MASTPISVIIPAYCASATLLKAIESVEAQRRIRPKIIVVIDGDDRATEQLLRGRRVKILRNEHRLGAPRARNQGLALADTPYVTFVDADDFIEGELQAAMVAEMERTGAALAFAPWRLSVPADPRHFHRNGQGASLLSRDQVLLGWAGGDYSKTGAMGWRTSALREIGGWDEAMNRFQDVEMGFRSVLRGLDHCFSDEGCLVYVTHHSAHRISEQPLDLATASFQRYFSLVEDYAATLSAPAEVRLATCRLSYNLARWSYRQKAYAAGDALLEIARRNGRIERLGSSRHKLGCLLLGPRRKLLVSNALSLGRDRLRALSPVVSQHRRNQAVPKA